MTNEESTVTIRVAETACLRARPRVWGLRTKRRYGLDTRATLKVTWRCHHADLYRRQGASFPADRFFMRRITKGVLDAPCSEYYK